MLYYEQAATKMYSTKGSMLLLENMQNIRTTKVEVGSVRKEKLDSIAEFRYLPSDATCDFNTKLCEERIRVRNFEET